MASVWRAEKLFACAGLCIVVLSLALSLFFGGSENRLIVLLDEHQGVVVGSVCLFLTNLESWKLFLSLFARSLDSRAPVQPFNLLLRAVGASTLKVGVIVLAVAFLSSASNAAVMVATATFILNLYVGLAFLVIYREKPEHITAASAQGLSVVW